ncbi:MAG: hypothetical protein HN366_07620 [Deltaproteobacteria bacterium]|jgi:acetyl esterase/lipase|nr:hypothetical protein [Deltaproteobacteria bacterium]
MARSSHSPLAFKLPQKYLLTSVYPATDITGFERESFKKYWDKVIFSGPVCDYYRKQYLMGPEDAANPLAPLCLPRIDAVSS